MEGGSVTNTFDEIYAAHFLYVRRFLLRLCAGNEHAADDLTQETFFQAYLSIHRFMGNCRVETWLCSIAQNVFCAYLRKEKRRWKGAEEEESTGYVMQEEHFFERDVAAALKQLSHRASQVLSYRFFHDMPFSEISQILGVSENSAKVIYHRGRIKLREILKKEYGYEL